MKVTSYKLQVLSYLTISYWLLPYSFLQAQQKNLPLNREYNLYFGNSEGFISAIKDTTLPGEPPLSIITPTFHYFESCLKPHLAAPLPNKTYKNKSLFIRKLKKESLFIINDTTDKFHLTADQIGRASCRERV